MKRATALVLIALTSACKKEPPPKPAPPPVNIEAASIAVVRSTQVTTGPRLSGTLQPQQSATILAEVGGTVSGVHVAEGQNVARGTRWPPSPTKPRPTPRATRGPPCSPARPRSWWPAAISIARQPSPRLAPSRAATSM